MRIRLDFYHPWTNALGLYWLRDVGAGGSGPWSDLELTVADGRRGDGLDALADGAVDWAVSYPNRVLARAAEGLDVVAVAALNQVPLESVVVAGDRPLSTFADLRGARIGYRRSPRMARLIAWLADRAGLDGDYEAVELYPAEPMPADIEAGTLDAAFGALWAWEGLAGVVAGADVHARGIAELGVAAYPGQVLATTRRRWERDRSGAERFLGSLGAAYRAAAASPDEAVGLIHEVAPYFSRRLFQLSLDAVSPTWTAAGGAWGTLAAEPLERYRGWLVDEGLVGAGVALEQAFPTLRHDPAGAGR